MGVLKDFSNFIGKHLCWSLFFNKVVGLQLYFKETPTQVFYCKIYKTFKKNFFIEHLQGLPLSVHIKEERAIDSVYIKYIYSTSSAKQNQNLVHSVR